MASKLRAIVKDLAIVVIGIIIIWVGLTTFFGTQNPFYVVSSGSMIPELQVYDIIVVQGNEPFEEVQIGDIIVFNRPVDHDRVIVHRVVAVIDDDPRTVRTQGDANPASIPGTDFPITEDEYIGTVAYVIPQIGFITRIFATQIGGVPLNYIIIAVIVGVMIIRQITGKKTHAKSRAPGTRNYRPSGLPMGSTRDFDIQDASKDSPMGSTRDFDIQDASKDSPMGSTRDSDIQDASKDSPMGSTRDSDIQDASKDSSGNDSKSGDPKRKD